MRIELPLQLAVGKRERVCVYVFSFLFQYAMCVHTHTHFLLVLIDDITHNACNWSLFLYPHNHPHNVEVARMGGNCTEKADFVYYKPFRFLKLFGSLLGEC